MQLMMTLNSRSSSLYFPMAGISGTCQYMPQYSSSSAHFFLMLFHSTRLTVQQDKLFRMCHNPWLNQKREIQRHLKQLQTDLTSLTKKNNVKDTESKASSPEQSTPTPEYW